jgi:hypothetical protein
MIDLTLIKGYLRIKLKQISTVGGIGIALVMIARAVGISIPVEMTPLIENLGMAVIAIILFFLKESGENDEIKVMVKDAAKEVAKEALKP